MGDGCRIVVGIAAGRRHSPREPPAVVMGDPSISSKPHQPMVQSTNIRSSTNPCYYSPTQDHTPTHNTIDDHTNPQYYHKYPRTHIFKQCNQSICQEQCVTPQADQTHNAAKQYFSRHPYIILWPMTTYTGTHHVTTNTGPMEIRPAIIILSGGFGVGHPSLRSHFNFQLRFWP